MSNASKKARRRERAARRNEFKREVNADQLKRCQEEAYKVRVTIRCNETQSGTGVGFHWLFDDEDTGRRIVEYWPGTGRWWCKATAEKGFEDDPKDMVWVAVNLRGKQSISANETAEERWERLGRTAED